MLRRCAALSSMRHWLPTTCCPTRGGASCLARSPQVIPRVWHGWPLAKFSIDFASDGIALCMHTTACTTHYRSMIRTVAVFTGVLERLAPVGGNTSVTAEADPSLLAPSTQAEARLVGAAAAAPAHARSRKVCLETLHLNESRAIACTAAQPSDSGTLR